MMEYSKGFWLGLILFIVGLLMIWLGSPTQLEMTGSVCSIAGFMWMIAEKIASPIAKLLESIHRDLHADHLKMLDTLGTLHKDHAKILDTLGTLHKDHVKILKIRKTH
jgi:hypothetical protein